jgi:very-short-patch-repair endonuclease
MATISPLEKMIAAIAQDIRAGITEFDSDVAVKTDSPIERTLLTALYAEITFNSLWREFSGFCASIGNHADDFTSAENDGLFAVILQAPIKKYRADFLVVAKPARAKVWRKLVVECDGHDFHERTKEQASRDRSRDRAMQDAGYTVFRFTGSEIQRDPAACARQVIQWTYRLSEADGTFV